MGVLSKEDKAILNELSTKCVNLINTWNKPQTTTVLKSTDKPQKDSFVLEFYMLKYFWEWVVDMKKFSKKNEKELRKNINGTFRGKDFEALSSAVENSVESVSISKEACPCKNLL